MSHVMVDLETMGTGSYAAIISIGAVKFSPNDGPISIEEPYYTAVTLESSMKAGLRVDAKTIEWWFSADRTAARERWLSEPKVDIDEALLGFSAWYGEDKTLPVWGNGATFDNVILSNAYLTTGLDKPWGYTADRCFRTFKSALIPAVKGPKVTAHHALDDAISQAVWLQKIVKKHKLQVA
jgi:hypothetical protein